MATKQKKVVWKSLKSSDCEVSAWSVQWVKITHAAFKGARVFRSKGEGHPFCSFSVPSSEGVCIAYRLVGYVPRLPSDFAAQV